MFSVQMLHGMNGSSLPCIVSKGNLRQCVYPWVMNMLGFLCTVLNAREDNFRFRMTAFARFCQYRLSPARHNNQAALATYYRAPLCPIPLSVAISVDMTQCCNGRRSAHCAKHRVARDIWNAPAKLGIHRKTVSS